MHRELTPRLMPTDCIATENGVKGRSPVQSALPGALAANQQLRR